MSSLSPSTAHTRLSPVVQIVDLACRAPSVHNTQPWLWRVRGESIELWADRHRQLPVADPEGRNMVISCGAALQHAQVAAGALGWTATVNRMPDAREPDFLACIELRPSGATPPDDAAGQLRAIDERRTDRRRFTSWPIPDGRLHQLAAAAQHWGARVVPLTEVTERHRVELLVSRAAYTQAADKTYAAEERAWIDHSVEDGIPAQVIPHPENLRGERRGRFTQSLYPNTTPEGLVQSSDGLLVIGTAYDGPLSWLQAGGALGALWLHATREGLSVVPLSQVIEVDETRWALQREVFSDTAEPQILVRIGWQEIGRSAMPRTPRRPLAEVIQP